MKTLLKTLVATAAVLAVVNSPCVQAQDSPVEIRDISAQMLGTPQYNFSRSADQRSDPEEWLAVEVEFSNEADMLDELTMRVHVALAQTTGRDGQRYFTGEVTYVNIFKGRNKFGVMYIAPNSLKMVNEGNMISKNDVEEIGVELLYKGRVMAQKNMKNDRIGPWWQTMTPIPGHLLNKNQAVPFAPLYWSRYEQIKTPQN